MHVVVWVIGAGVVAIGRYTASVEDDRWAVCANGLLFALAALVSG